MQISYCKNIGEMQYNCNTSKAFGMNDRTVATSTFAICQRQNASCQYVLLKISVTLIKVDPCHLFYGKLQTKMYNKRQQLATCGYCFLIISSHC